MFGFRWKIWNCLIGKYNPGGEGGGTARMRMIDKTTGPFRVAGGRWVRAGPLERAIEGPRQQDFFNVAAFGSEA